MMVVGDGAIFGDGNKLHFVRAVDRVVIRAWMVLETQILNRTNMM